MPKFSFQNQTMFGIVFYTSRYFDILVAKYGKKREKISKPFRRDLTFFDNGTKINAKLSASLAAIALFKSALWQLWQLWQLRQLRQKHQPPANETNAVKD